MPRPPAARDTVLAAIVAEHGEQAATMEAGAARPSALDSAVSAGR